MPKTDKGMTKHILGLQIKWFNCFYKGLAPRKKFCHLSIFENVVLFDSLRALGKLKKWGGKFFT